LSFYYLNRNADDSDDVNISEISVFYAGLWETFYIIAQEEISEELIKEIKK